ncbi:hypothetical protein C8R31_101818 [Nitrosospira sp. Nsp2]|nr:hypothetical protein C8R31_101818 [Nitrosospira sp. Nsp2]
MTIYAFYTRTKKGSIQRDHFLFDWKGPLGPYAHEAPLVGWPESKVFWIYEKGHSNGLAPVCASSSDSSGIEALEPALSNTEIKKPAGLGVG